jgi:hypothetical protein
MVRPRGSMVGTHGWPWSRRGTPGRPPVGSGPTRAVVSPYRAGRRCGHPLVATWGVPCPVVPARTWLGATPAVAHRARPAGPRGPSATAARQGAVHVAAAPGRPARGLAGVGGTQAASGPVRSARAGWETARRWRALAPAHRPRWCRSGRDERPWRGRRPRLGVRGPERTPRVRAARDALGSGAGPPGRRLGAQRQPMRAPRTRGRRVAPRLGLRVLPPARRQAAGDPGSSLMPSGPPWPLAPCEDPGACWARQRERLRPSSGGREAPGPACAKRGPVERLRRGSGACRRPTLRRDRPRIATPPCQARVLRRGPLGPAVIASVVIRAIRGFQAHADEWWVLRVDQRLQRLAADRNPVASGTTRQAVCSWLAGAIRPQGPRPRLGPIERTPSHRRMHKVAGERSAPWRLLQGA